VYCEGAPVVRRGETGDPLRPGERAVPCRTVPMV